MLEKLFEKNDVYYNNLLIYKNVKTDVKIYQTHKYVSKLFT